MVYTELVPRRQQFRVAPAMLQPNSAVTEYTTSVDIKNKTKTNNKKHAIKGYSHSFRITRDMSAVSLLENREQRYTNATNDTNDNM